MTLLICLHGEELLLFSLLSGLVFVIMVKFFDCINYGMTGDYRPIYEKSVNLLVFPAPIIVTTWLLFLLEFTYYCLPLIGLYVRLICEFRLLFGVSSPIITASTSSLLSLLLSSILRHLSSSLSMFSGSCVHQR
jgi:hypothetical protein